KDARGRRVTAGAPEQSLLLRKPSGAVPHGGGLRLPKSSPGYRILRDWLRSGAPGPAAREPRLVAISLTPAEAGLSAGGQTQLRVTARYDRGPVREVTRWARFVSNQDNVAAVDDVGLATVTGTGEAVIRAQFGGQVAISRLLIPVRGATEPGTFSS